MGAGADPGLQGARTAYAFPCGNVKEMRSNPKSNRKTDHDQDSDQVEDQVDQEEDQDSEAPDPNHRSKTTNAKVITRCMLTVLWLHAIWHQRN